MKIPIYQVDAFTSRVFGGNPAAVCPLESWLDDATLQAIAAENNLSETAFFVGRDGKYDIRWMTPVAEVDLCGHATLASGWVVFNRLEPARDEVEFGSRSGPLKVVREGDLLALDFPARPPEPIGDARAVGEAISDTRLQCYAAFTSGWVAAWRGDSSLAIDDCERSVVAAQQLRKRAAQIGVWANRRELGRAARSQSRRKLARCLGCQRISHCDQAQPSQHRIGVE